MDRWHAIGVARCPPVLEHCKPKKQVPGFTFACSARNTGGPIAQRVCAVHITDPCIVSRVLFQFLHDDNPFYPSSVAGAGGGEALGVGDDLAPDDDALVSLPPGCLLLPKPAAVGAARAETCFSICRPPPCPATHLPPLHTL